MSTNEEEEYVPDKTKPGWRASEAHHRADEYMKFLKTYDGCIHKFRNRLAGDMRWEFKDSMKEFEDMIDDNHKKLVENFCRTLYKDEFKDKAEKKKLAKEQFKAIEDDSYKMMLDHFGEDKVAED